MKLRKRILIVAGFRTLTVMAAPGTSGWMDGQMERGKLHLGNSAFLGGNVAEFITQSSKLGLICRTSVINKLDPRLF